MINKGRNIPKIRVRICIRVVIKERPHCSLNFKLFINNRVDNIVYFYQSWLQ